MSPNPGMPGAPFLSYDHDMDQNPEEPQSPGAAGAPSVHQASASLVWSLRIREVLARRKATGEQQKKARYIKNHQEASLLSEESAPFVFLQYRKPPQNLHREIPMLLVNKVKGEMR